MLLFTYVFYKTRLIQRARNAFSLLSLVCRQYNFLSPAQRHSFDVQNNACHLGIQAQLGSDTHVSVHFEESYSTHDLYWLLRYTRLRNMVFQVLEIVPKADLIIPGGDQFQAALIKYKLTCG